MKKTLGFGLIGLSLGLVFACENTDPEESEVAGCTAHDNEDGTYDLTCDGTTITVRNGSDGQDGNNGQNGSDGQVGAVGANGQNGAKGDQGDKGDQGNSCTVGPLFAEAQEGMAGALGMGGDVTEQPEPGKFVVTCGETSVVIADGLTSLIVITPDTTVCAADGQKISAGADDNHNHVLDPDEVTQESFICNGESAEIDPCLFYGGAAVEVSDNIRICDTAVEWGTWDEDLILGDWKVCDKTQWAAYAPSSSPSDFGQESLWINNDDCGEGSHREVYEGYPMNEASCYDGENCCWNDSTVLRFAVCAP